MYHVCNDLVCIMCVYPGRGHAQHLQDACTSRQQSLGVEVEILFQHAVVPALACMDWGSDFRRLLSLHALAARLVLMHRCRS